MLLHQLNQKSSYVEASQSQKQKYNSATISAKMLMLFSNFIGLVKISISFKLHHK